MARRCHQAVDIGSKSIVIINYRPGADMSDLEPKRKLEHDDKALEGCRMTEEKKKGLHARRIDGSRTFSISSRQ